MKYQGLTLLGLFIAAANNAGFSSEQISNKLEKLIYDCSISFSSEKEKEYFLSYLEELSKKDNITKILNNFVSLYIVDDKKDIKTINFMQGDISKLDTQKFIELPENQKGIVDGELIIVDKKSVSSAEHRLDLLLQELSNYIAEDVLDKHEVVVNEEVDVNKHIDDEVIKRVYQEVLNDDPQPDLDKNIDNYLEDLSKYIIKNKEYQDNKIIKKIAARYNNLDEIFIKDYYGLKDELSTEYNIGEKLLLLHRIIFKDVDDLRKFVEIVCNHGYHVNVDESKYLVDVFRYIEIVDGRILSEIFDIANQAAYLNGYYNGYLVI